ncbi:MAG: anion transporter [Gammaproteobacteria bacterium]|nr:anion transporter [Gammaproteobacteria bacterium]
MAINVPFLVLVIVFLLIAARRIGQLHVPMWLAMTLGAVTMLVTGSIGPRAALAAIDLDVMVFLCGMFVVGEAMVGSGYLYVLADRWLCRVQRVDTLILTLLFGVGLMSAILMNDTLAIIGTPLAIKLAREHRLDPKLLLLTLAFAVTIGSVMSPIGNPQNLLIAIQGGMPEPFTRFLGALAIPTLINLLLCYAVLRWRWREQFRPHPLVHAEATLIDPALARWVRLSLWIIMILIVIKISLVMAGSEGFRLSWIAIGGALPLLMLSSRRGELLRKTDWRTLIFFAAMFVLMNAVWQTGFFQQFISAQNTDLTAIPAVLGFSMIGSQLISNVPWVALYLPLLHELGANEAALMALAAGSTIAGNLLILGAASNVIMVQHAERQGVSVSFLDFARLGVILAPSNALVYWVYLEWWY